MWISQNLPRKFFFWGGGLVILLVVCDSKNTNPRHYCESVLTLCVKILVYRLILKHTFWIRLTYPFTYMNTKQII